MNFIISIRRDGSKSEPVELPSVAKMVNVKRGKPRTFSPSELFNFAFRLRRSMRSESTTDGRVVAIHALDDALQAAREARLHPFDNPTDVVAFEIVNE